MCHSMCCSSDCFSLKNTTKTSRRQTTPSQSQPATANCVVYKMSIWIAALKGGCRRLTWYFSNVENKNQWNSKNTFPLLKCQSRVYFRRKCIQQWFFFSQYFKKGICPLVWEGTFASFFLFPFIHRTHIYNCLVTAL